MNRSFGNWLFCVVLLLCKYSADHPSVASSSRREMLLERQGRQSVHERHIQAIPDGFHQRPADRRDLMTRYRCME